MTNVLCTKLPKSNEHLDNIYSKFIKNVGCREILELIQEKNNTFINRPSQLLASFIIPNWPKIGWCTSYCFIVQKSLLWVEDYIILCSFCRKNHANNIVWDISCANMETQQCFLINLYRCQFLRFVREQISLGNLTGESTEITLV